MTQDSPAARGGNAVIRVLLVDDDPLVLVALRQLLRTDPLIEVVGALDDGAQVINEARRLTPHVVLLDARMRIVSAPEVIAPLRRAFPELGILVMSSFLGEQAENAILLAGANAFVPKIAPAQKILTEVRRAAGVATAPGPRALLSGREREVARAVADGLTNSEIAELLGLTASTTRTYVSRLFAKADVRTRLQLATAVHAGVLDISDAND